MKRYWRPLKFILLGALALAAIGLICISWLQLRAGARLERKLAELRAAGEPVRLVDLAREPIPPETNAATYLERAKSAVEAMEKEIEAAYDAMPEGEQRKFDHEQLPPAMEKAIRSALDAYPGTIELLEQASQCTGYDPQWDFTLDQGAFTAEFLPRVQSSRAVIRLLSRRVQLMLAEGNQDEALRTMLVMFRLCRQFEREPMLVGYLVAVACRNVSISCANRILRSGPVPDDVRDTLDAQLALADEVESYQQSLRSDRANGIECFREFPQVWIFKNDECDYLDVMSEEIAAAALPYAPFDAPRLRKLGTLTRLLVPALDALRVANARDRAKIRSLRILNALQRHPDDVAVDPLNLLAASLPAEAVVDPFNGKPMNIKRVPQGWLVYSVGANLADDGGDLDEEKLNDTGLGPLPSEIVEDGVESR